MAAPTVSPRSLTPARPRRLWLRPAAVAIPIYLAACVAPDGGLLRAARFRDVHLYQGFANAVFDGHVPYRDFFMEYPPAAIPAFVVPAAGGTGERGYFHRFQALLLLLAGLTIVASGILLARASSLRLYGASVVIGAAPALLGPTFFARYDLWPAALVALALVALARGRELLGVALLAVGTAAKVYPAVIVPLAIVYVWKRAGARGAAIAAGLFCAVAGAIMLPFAALGLGGLGYSFYTQTTRALEFESLGGALLLAAHKLGLYHAGIVDQLSFNLVGTTPKVLGALLTVAEILLLLCVWFWFARSRAGVDELLLAAAAAVTVFVAFGKVLSPQYLIWLVPLVPLAAGRFGALASGLLVAALLLTQGWFPRRFHDAVSLGDSDWLIVARDGVLVALAGLLLFALRRLSAQPSRAARSEAT